MYKKLSCLFLLMGCITFYSYSQPGKKLGEVFIQSVAENNFQLMKPYMLNIASAKKLFGAELGKMSLLKQTETIKKFNATLQSKWKSIVANARNHKVDFSKLTISRVKLADIKDAGIYSSLLVTYKYNGIEWDDVLVFVNREGTHKYLMEIPLTTYMFTFNEERRGKNLRELEVSNDKNQDLKGRLQAEVERIKDYAISGQDSLLTSLLVYRGEEDKETRWKRALDPKNAGDVEQAKSWIKKLKKGFASCTEMKFGDVRVEKESEGTWHVIQAICEGKKLSYAFLKVNENFLLGDVDDHD